MKHLKDVNKTYFQHMVGAFKYVIFLHIIGIKLIIHAFVPCVLETAASDDLQKLIKTMSSNSTKDVK